VSLLYGRTEPDARDAHPRRMYSTYDFGRMLAHPRVSAYTSALARAIRPGDVVVDIGTGTGYFAMVAARLGARKVYAIEGIRQACEIARTTVRDNGLEGVVEVIHGLSTELELPELADVAFGDLRGRLPTFGANVASMADARARLLKPEGRLLPLRDHVLAALVESDELHEHFFGGFRDSSFDLAACRKAVTHEIHDDDKCTVRFEQLVTAPERLFTIEYGVPTDVFRGDIELVARRSGVAHAIALWFDAEIDAHAGFSNVPGGKLTVYGRVVLPWDEPVPLVEGERVRMSAVVRTSGHDHLFSFATTAGGRRVRQTTVALTEITGVLPPSPRP
jgi:protein arginine N-methyltransferase 1